MIPTSQQYDADPCRNSQGQGRRPLEVAVIGGGLVGLALAVGLHHRSISFTLYERAATFGELGVGITVTPNGQRALAGLDPRLEEAYLTVAHQTPWEFLTFLDGFNQPRSRNADPKFSVEDLIYQLRLPQGFRACRRSDLVNVIVKLIPRENVRFGKCLQSAQTPEDEGRTILRFQDGPTAEADVVIGCDGIRSRLRSLMFGSGPGHPGAQYSHQLGFRSILPLSQVTSSLGPEKTSTALWHSGPGGYVISFPLPAPANSVHVEAFVTDPSEWPDIDNESDTKRYVLPASRNAIETAFADFGPTVRTLITLLPEKLNKWAVFDLLDAPVPVFARGPMCLAGDAAHASTPNHGGGASIGFEDGLMLAEVLAVLSARPLLGADDVAYPLTVYSEMRHTRSQWLVESSRRLFEIFTWKDSPHGIDKKSAGAEIEERSHQLWDYDIVGETSLIVKSKLAHLLV